MALSNAAPFITSPSVYCVARFSYRFPFSGYAGAGNSGFCVGSHAVKSDVLIERRRLKPMNIYSVENYNNNDNNNNNNNILIKPTFQIPVSCYQLIGVPDQAEKDEIVKAVMGLKNAEIEEGYTMDVVASRQDLLMDVRDKLLFEPEYAGDGKEKIPPKSSLHIPWSWVPGALCLLQEVGESKLVLDIGRASLQHQDAKPYADDLLLAMALAECVIAKIGFEKKKVSQGFEALARAQCILRSKPSLAKMALLSQIEESLEEFAPACTLELLSTSHIPENVDKRRGAIAALRELLRQGLDGEASCQVQDWPSFLSQAFDNLLANEIVDLLPWDNIAVVRKNKKTIESHNLRVVIDANCFYRVFAAHMALGFFSKQKELINKAKSICECLIASEGIDLKFEEAFCLFLLGQGTETEAVEKLKKLELNLNPKHNSVLGKAIIDASAANPSLELWLKNSVLALFPDTKDCSPDLANFFNARKKFSGSKETTGVAQTLPSICHRPLSTSGSLDRRETEEPRSYMSSSPNIGFAVKQLAPTDLQSSLLSGRNEEANNLSDSPVQVKRSLNTQHNGIWGSHFTHAHIFGKVTYISVLGCIVFSTMKLMGMNFSRTVYASHGALTKAYDYIAWNADSSGEYSVGPAYFRGGNIADSLKKILSTVKMPFLHKSGVGKHSDLHTFLTSLSSPINAYRRLMPVKEAEILVKQWQTIKAEALGPSHEVNCLAEVLDESMLVQWQALADAAEEKSCHWRFLLLNLSVIRADILLDGNGVDIAEIEALLEEAAELVDDSQKKNPNYYSTYRVKYILKRQEHGSWKFCEGDIRTPSYFRPILIPRQVYSLV